MIAERSERGALTTKADSFTLNSYDTPFSSRIISSQWQIENNNLISYRFFFDISSASGYELQQPNYSRRFYNLTWTGTTTNNDELEYGIVQSYYNSNTTVFETEYFPSGTTINTYPEYQRPGDATPVYSYTLYVRRKDGGVITPSSMEYSIASMMALIRFDSVQTTAIPQDWLTGTADTFTTDFSTMTTVVPTICDIDDHEFNAFIDIPNKIVAGINLCIVGIGSLLNLKYVTFMICFVLIVGLIAWLIH